MKYLQDVLMKVTKYLKRDVVMFEQTLHFNCLPLVNKIWYLRRTMPALPGDIHLFPIHISRITSD